jgi:hypothetical protein
LGLAEVTLLELCPGLPLPMTGADRIPREV